MIQFNLLPDVKLEFIKAERLKHAVISGAVIASGVALAIFLLLFLTVHVVQKQIMNKHTDDIKKYSAELKETKDLDKILTIQNQLGSMTDLHASKPAETRTFNLVHQMTPSKVKLTEIAVDHELNTFVISGESDTLSDTNAMVDTIKYVTFTAEGQESKKVFSNVVLAEFSRNTKAASFTINANFDPTIYDNATELKFNVPSGISTRSVVEQPQLFTKPSNQTNQDQ